MKLLQYRHATLVPRWQFAALCAVLLLVSFVTTPPASAAPPAGFQTSLVVGSGLNGPSGFEFAPDGRVFIIEREGKIKIYKNGGLLPTLFAENPSVASGDRGQIGIAFDPDWKTNHYVYFYYTSTDQLNYLVRYNSAGDVGTNRTILYHTNSPSDRLHVGGSIRFGADGKLYFGVGDNGYAPNAQNLANPHGKILRINKDGTVPTDNPFYGQSGKLAEIWAYGLRNSWRFQFDSVTGNLYGGDPGDFTWEEVNRIVKGGNYGWPLVEGKCTAAICPYIDPIHMYNHDHASAAVTGGPVYRGTMFPAAYRGRYFYGDYARGFIRTLTLDANGNSTGAQDFDMSAGSVVDLKTAPDGSLWYVNYHPAQLRQITYNPGSHVPVPNATANKDKGVAPLSVHFSSAGTTDPDGNPLTYDWDFGDGTHSTAPNPTKTYPNKGRYTVQLRVSDGTTSVPAVPFIIQVGLPPTVNISRPTEGSTYKAGDTITYNASALDGAGFELDDGKISTDVIFHHGTHTHPFLDDLIGRAKSFTLPDTGEAAPDTWYEIKTTATDENGLQATKSVNIFPRTSNVTLRSKPAGPQVLLDGRPTSTPSTFAGVQNFKRELSAPTRQVVGSTWYDFWQWSDGGSQRHMVHTPERDSTYTATFRPSGSFKVRYYDNPNLSGRPKIVRTDANIDFFWGGGSPEPSIPVNYWSARWTKDQFFAGGRYRFTTVADDGVRLYVDEKLQIDKWRKSSVASYSVDIDLTRGYHQIRMEYFEDTAEAVAKLSFDLSPTQPSSPSRRNAEPNWWNRRF